MDPQGVRLPARLGDAIRGGAPTVDGCTEVERQSGWTDLSRQLNHNRFTGVCSFRLREDLRPVVRDAHNAVQVVSLKALGDHRVLHIGDIHRGCQIPEHKLA